MSSPTQPPRPQSPRPIDPRTIPVFTPFIALCVWVGWKWTWNGKKWDKPPLQRKGHLASSKDPTTWATFDEIWTGVQSGRFDGCGLMLLGQKGAFIDLDNVRNPNTGALLPWAQQLIALVPGVYVEITPSGRGVRIVGTFDASPSIHKGPIKHSSGDGAYEVYVNPTTGRYVTVSGHQLRGHTDSGQPCDISPIVAALIGAGGGNPRNKPNGEHQNAHGGKIIDLRDPRIDQGIAELIEHGTKNGQPSADRSDDFYWAVRHLHGLGYSLADVLATLEAYPNGVQEKYIDGNRLEKELRRVWEEKLADQPIDGSEFDDQEEAVPDDQKKKSGPKLAPGWHSDPAIDVIAEAAAFGGKLTIETLVTIFNRRYAVVSEGGKTVVIGAVRDPKLKRDYYERMSFEDFLKLYQNHSLTVTDSKGNETTRSYAQWWLYSYRRRQYVDGVVFDPSTLAYIPRTLNLWRGWAVTPKQGDWSLMKQHILEVICKGRRNIARYVYKWLAHMAQHPESAAQVAIVLRGLKGTGKGMFGKWILRMCGQHGLHIVNAGHLIGRFTGHLRDAVFVFADEAFFAGDKQHEGALKGFITEDTVMIEAKYRNPVMAPNVLHLLMASNSDWVVPATHDERRYLVLDVADTQRRSKAYFDQLDWQMAQGGLEAMLHDLLKLDLTGFHPRDVPDTAEMAEQVVLSDSLHRWWLDVLGRGFIWRSRHGFAEFTQWEDFASTELLGRSYSQWCADNRVHYPQHRAALGRFMNRFYQAHRATGPEIIYEAETISSLAPVSPVVMQDRPHGYRLGTLDAARTAFADRLKMPTDARPWNTEEAAE
jgi:hypothetical protein